MTASVVIGSSIVMTVTSGPQVFGMPLFTVLGLAGLSAGVRQQRLDRGVDLAYAVALRAARYRTRRQHSGLRPANRTGPMTRLFSVMYLVQHWLMLQFQSKSMTTGASGIPRTAAS